MNTADPVCGIPVDPARAITARENDGLSWPGHRPAPTTGS